MGEKRIIVEKETISYEGLLDVKELYKLINEWSDSKDYVPVEKSCQECVSKVGKCVECEMEPFKKLTDYAKSVIKINVKVDECVDVKVKRAGKEQKLQKGKLTVEFKGTLETDYEHRWERYSWMYVIRGLFEKYFWTPLFSGFEKVVREDIDHLKSEVAGFLNLYR